MSSFSNRNNIGVAALLTTSLAVGAAMGFFLGRHHSSLLVSSSAKSNNSQQKFKLIFSYLDAKSAGEAIRLALYLLGMDFQDRRLTYSQIDRLRKCGYLPFGQVPALEVEVVDGDDDEDDSKTEKRTQVHAQSLAILRWVGRQGGGRLYPDNTTFSVQIDQVLEAVNEMKNVLRPAFYAAVLGRNPVTSEPLVQLNEAQTKATLDALNNIVLPVRFGMLERLLTHISNGPLVCGGGGNGGNDNDNSDDLHVNYNLLTIADLDLYVFAHGILNGTDAPPGISASVLDHCPRIKKLVQAVANHPGVAEWNQRRTCSVSTDEEIDRVVKRGFS